MKTAYDGSFSVFLIIHACIWITGAYKLYRNKSYLGCGDVTIDTKSGLDALLDKEKYKEFDLSGNTGVFYRYNSKKNNLEDKDEGEVVEASA